MQFLKEYLTLMWTILNYSEMANIIELEADSRD